MGLDPQAQRLIAMLGAAGSKDASRISTAERRASFAALMRMAARPGTGATVIEATVRGAAGLLPARVYAPAGIVDEPGAGLVYLHGGGLVAGSLDTHDALCRNLAAASMLRIVAVGYRLAPEYPFPAAVEDAAAATRDVLDRAAAFGLDPLRIGIGGDSAGGTLATVTAGTLATQPGPCLACQLLLCPVLDIAPRTPSRVAFGEGYLLDAALMLRDLADYGSGRPDPDDPRLSPLRAADLARMPRTLIHTAEFDPLRDEGALYAGRLREVGVAVDLRCHAGMIHHFYGLTGFIPAAARALSEIAGEVGRVLSDTVAVRA